MSRTLGPGAQVSFVSCLQSVEARVSNWFRIMLGAIPANLARLTLAT